MKKALIAVISAMLVLSLLSGCASSKNNSSTSDSVAPGGSGTAPSAPEAEKGGDFYDGVSAGEIYQNENQTSAEEMYGGRKVIRTYDLSIETNDFDGVLSAIEARLAQFGGYSQNSAVNGRKPAVYGDPGRSAELTLRVPAENADEFVSGVKGMGTLVNSHDYTNDITDEYFDTDSRLDVLQTELDRLKSILVETDNLADVITLESRISEVMYEIEQLTGTLRKYDALVYYTTVEINLYEENLKEGPAGAKTTGERIGEGFMNSLYGVGTFFTNLFVWLVSSLPVLAVLAAIAAAIYLIVRAATKRSAKRRAEDAAKAAVRQQALFEQQKAAYIEQQKAQSDSNNEQGESKEDAENEGK